MVEEKNDNHCWYYKGDWQFSKMHISLHLEAEGPFLLLVVQ